MAISVEQYLLHNYPSFESFPTLLRRSIITLFKKIAHEDEINAFVIKNSNKDTFGFIEAVLDYFDVDLGINQNELARIPSYGRLVIVANHPLGALDALALLHVIKQVRKDVKIVASNFLSHFENLEGVLIPIENIRSKMAKESVDAIYSALKQEQVVIIFPSGEVSRVRPSGVKDTKWRKGFLKIAQKMMAPILPIYIEAKNSKNFYLLSMLNKSLATATIPHEMFKFHNKKITFRIGKSIPYESYNLPSLSLDAKVRLFRKHFYEVAKKHRGVFKTHNSIALAENRQELKEELQKFTLLGSTKDAKQIYLYSTSEDTSILREIGRLREISFRQVKEGSGKKRDLDEFDYSYEHIVLWDDKALEIVGSYRVMKGEDIYDIEQLYTATLFHYKDSFDTYLKDGLELGRSFIQPKYWNTRALDYLWQGIGAYLRHNPQIRYLFGGVSISRAYDEEACSLLVYFYSKFFPSKDQSVQHKESFFIPQDQRERLENLFCANGYEQNLKILKELLEEKGYAIPTLYKQYSDLCEEGGVCFLDFGKDKDFDDCVDGFILVDLDKLKEQKRKRYLA